jgi:hypothetical protein
MLCTVTVGLASTRRTTRTAVISIISAFHRSPTPAAAAVPVADAQYAAREPPTVTAPTTAVQRLDSDEVRSASSRITANRPTCSSVVSFLLLNADSR